MIDFSKHISTLLFDHDCVILPGFGGFVCNYKPATVQSIQHLFSPPSKTILFNSRLKNNDGLLANHISTLEKVSYEEALQKAEKFSRDIFLTINNGEAFTLENVGRFYTDKDGIIQFEQNTKINFLKDAHGLSNVVSPAIARNSRKGHKLSKPVFANRKSGKKRKPSTVSLRKAVAVVPVLIIAGLIIINFSKINNIWENQTTLVPSIPMQQSSTLENNNVSETDLVENQGDEKVHAESSEKAFNDLITAGNHDPITLTSSEKKNVEMVDENITSTYIQAENTDNLPLAQNTTTQRMYHFIAGSFQSLANAEKLVAEYSDSDLEARVIGQTENGYYRVSIAAYLRKDVAIAELKKVRERYNDNIWLLRY